MSLLNSGPYQHNRFSAIDELYERERRYYTDLAEKKKAKPDFLDVDGDGDKDESFKKGVKDKEKGGDKKEGKKGLPDFLKKKKDVKESKCGSGCDCDDCKKAKKKAMTEWIHNLVDEGYDLSEYNMDQMEEMYDDLVSEMIEEEAEEITIEDAIMSYLIDNGFANNIVSAEVLYNNMSEGWRDDVVNQIQELYAGKHGQTEKEYQDGRSQAGKMISGDSKMSGAKYTHGSKVSDGGAGPNAAGGSKKPQAQGKMDKGSRNELMFRKANMKKKS